MSDIRSSGIPRRPDLDALRAFAMLLGIALHAALSFTGFPWTVQDLKPNGLFGLFFAAIHGFRMPLFFLVSGYFTMMLWRQRGLNALLKQRFQRVFLPFMLALATIVPALHSVSSWSTELTSRQDAQRRASQGAGSELVELVRKRDLAGIERQLAGGADPNQVDPEFGLPALNWAAMYGDLPTAQLLIDRGANVNVADESGYGPLHGASFMGHSEVMDLLIRRGAKTDARGKLGDMPRDSTKADWFTTKAIADSLHIPLKAEAELQAGRAACRQLLAQNSVEKEDLAAIPGGPESGLDRARQGYAKFLASDRLAIRWSQQGVPFHLILTSVFDHLWFLWFLCWLVVLFAVLAIMAERIDLPRFPRRLVVSPLRWLWLLPITMIPQLLMGSLSPGFGPDTSAGIIPQPHLLLYYGIFFGFGSLYFDSDDRDGRLGRWWWLSLLLALLIALPMGLVTIGQTALTGPVQASYTWAMTFGLIGLFRSVLARENRTIRYLSDSAYWLYLAHLPVVILVQTWVREWDLPAVLKFALVCAVVTGFLLFTYQTMVRYTWLGRLLNGPRTRPAQAIEPRFMTEPQAS